MPALIDPAAMSIAPEHRLVPGRKRVVAAMSGGVDSAVAAALLKAEGHEVVGVTLQLYDHGEATRRKGACCAGQDIHDARRVADYLGIAHYVLDYEKRFENSVIRPFADSYAAGETPVPCVSCNVEIKFKRLLDTAIDLGADLLATGHYISRRDTPAGPRLVRAADADRDQSYFLFATTRSQLERLCFPLGEMNKNDVRDIARRMRLPVAEKPDSQDICFVPSGRYSDVVARLRPDTVSAGDIVHVDGRVLGRHNGTAGYTVGQRRGLGVYSAEPLYVVKLEPSTSRVVVGSKQDLRTTVIALRSLNWLGDEEQKPHTREIFVKLRSQQSPVAASLHQLAGGRAIVELTGAEFGVAAGQACVFYADASPRAEVLGGGVIDKAGTTAAPAYIGQMSAT